MNRRILAAAAAFALFAFAHPARAACSSATTNGWFTTAGRTAGAPRTPTSGCSILT